MLLNITARRLARASFRNRSCFVIPQLNNRRSFTGKQSSAAQSLTQHQASNFLNRRRMATTTEAAAVQVADAVTVDLKDNPLLAVSSQACGPRVWC